jgi:hypothetical protein
MIIMLTMTILVVMVNQFKFVHMLTEQPEGKLQKHKWRLKRKLKDYKDEVITQVSPY